MPPKNLHPPLQAACHGPRAKVFLGCQVPDMPAINLVDWQTPPTVPNVQGGKPWSAVPLCKDACNNQPPIPRSPGSMPSACLPRSMLPHPHNMQRAGASGSSRMWLPLRTAPLYG
jgi:hypothetical protein